MARIVVLDSVTQCAGRVQAGDVLVAGSFAGAREPSRGLVRAHADRDAERAGDRVRVGDHTLVVDTRAVADARRHRLDRGDRQAEPVGGGERADAGLVLSHAGRVRDQRPDAKRQRQAEREGAGERPGDEDVPELHAALALRDGVEDDNADHAASVSTYDGRRKTAPACRHGSV